MTRNTQVCSFPINQIGLTMFAYLIAVQGRLLFFQSFSDEKCCMDSNHSKTSCNDLQNKVLLSYAMLSTGTAFSQALIFSWNISSECFPEFKGFIGLRKNNCSALQCAVCEKPEVMKSLIVSLPRWSSNFVKRQRCILSLFKANSWGSPNHDTFLTSHWARLHLSTEKL